MSSGALAAADPAAPRPAEERSYLAFAFAAVLIVLGAGLGLGVAAALSRDARFAEALAQAHTTTQLEGWIGLFVAGMGLRLAPRLAGRRPLSSGVTVSVLVLLVAATAVGVAAPWAPGLRVAGAIALAGASMILAAAMAVSLASRGREWHAWRLAAWAGAAWWPAWALLALAGALAAGDGAIPDRIETAWVWVGLCGSLSNFVWAVQSRSVPVFFGRALPDALRMAPPLVVLNAGVILVYASAFGPTTLGPGLLLAGAGTAWLAPVAGSVWGKANRLRMPSRHAAHFIVAANAWAVAGGAGMMAAGILEIAGAAVADRVRDAAVHALGLGFMTVLIVGMAQLLMPAFAGERISRPRTTPERWPALALLVAATLLRVTAEAMPAGAQAAAVAASGLLAWLGLASFGIGMARVTRARAWRSPGR